MYPASTLHRIITGALLSLTSITVGGAALAQSVFVKLAGQKHLPPILAIPAPGYAWEHSAAAPVQGLLWNQIARPSGIDITDPAMTRNGKTGVGRLGSHPILPATGIELLDPAGQSTPVRLTLALNVHKLATDKFRSEPYAVVSTGTNPSALMDSNWRVYLSENGLTFTLTGLKPTQTYDLYVYSGNAFGGGNNPDGEYAGLKLTLGIGNSVPGQPDTAEILGGFSGNLYTYDPDANRISLTPRGTTWTMLSIRADTTGAISFSTTANRNRQQYINGFQLIETK